MTRSSWCARPPLETHPASCTDLLSRWSSAVIVPNIRTFDLPAGAFLAGRREGGPPVAGAGAHRRRVAAVSSISPGPVPSQCGAPTSPPHTCTLLKMLPRWSSRHRACIRSLLTEAALCAAPAVAGEDAAGAVSSVADTAPLQPVPPSAAGADAAPLVSPSLAAACFAAGQPVCISSPMIRHQLMSAGSNRARCAALLFSRRQAGVGGCAGVSPGKDRRLLRDLPGRADHSSRQGARQRGLPHARLFAEHRAQQTVCPCTSAHVGLHPGVGV